MSLRIVVVRAKGDGYTVATVGFRLLLCESDNSLRELSEHILKRPDDEKTT